jgi:formylglycine-generating enzyme required for sulfatase activity
MPRWFLSYHSPDQALAERLRDAIERKDPASRIFFAPAHLRTGGLWTAQLAHQIADATAFVLLVGEKGIGPWQVLEYDEALDRWAKSPAEFPLIVVLLAGQTAPGLPFLRRLHWVVTPDPASEKDVARLFDAASGGGTNPGELWRYTSPYRGLEAMTERDSDYFFGRSRETTQVLKELAGSDGLPVLIGNSGVGKSSVAQAGVLASLKRETWPEIAGGLNNWPPALRNSRRWCFLTLRPGTEPVRSLVEAFLETWQLDRTSTEWPERRAEWVEALLSRRLGLRDLLDQTNRRYEELQRPGAPAYFVYVDQGEELYVRAKERQRGRFSELLADAHGDPRLRTLMSLRADFFGELQKDEPLHKVYRQIEVPPLRRAELGQVVSEPAKLLSARFESEDLVEIIATHAAEDSVKDVGALPLLSYTLEDMWTQMVGRGDGTLRLPMQSFELGGVLVDRANTFLAAHPGSEAALRRILTLRCAAVHKDSEPTRRRAAREEFSEEEWRLVSELADNPNRLLVTTTTDSGETCAEVAHEAIFRRWDKLREWIATEREFLIWRTGLEAARGCWQDTPDALKADALLMGAALSQAQSWVAKRADGLPARDRDFVALSIARDRKARARARSIQALIYVLLVGVIGGLVGWINQESMSEQWRWWRTERPFMMAHIRPYALEPAAEQALKPKDLFRECSVEQEKDYCPQMVVLPAGSFIMGSPATEPGHQPSEEPQHKVTIARPFAASKFQLTFEEWDTCVAYGDCPKGISDSGWGRGQEPVINVTWDDAQRYVSWLSKTTGRPYRLLTEAEYEYAARAGSAAAYPWGDDVGQNNANCKGCGSRWDNTKTAPVGSFAANSFGLYDMVGNVWEWVEDCVNENYEGAPRNASAWTEGGECKNRIVRGGSWNNTPVNLRSAVRNGPPSSGFRDNLLGFRIARTLIGP